MEKIDFFLFKSEFEDKEEDDNQEEGELEEEIDKLQLNIKLIDYYEQYLTNNDKSILYIGLYIYFILKTNSPTFNMKFINNIERYRYSRSMKTDKFKSLIFDLLELSYDRFDKINFKREPGNHFKLIINGLNQYNIESFIKTILSSQYIEIIE